MSISTSMLNGALGLISMLYPKAVPVIAVIEQMAPHLPEAIALVKAGVEEGPGALRAAEEAAPELAKQIRHLASQARSLGVSFGSTEAAHEENITRAIFGHPQMSFEEEQKWMNSTAGYDPSQENSRNGSG